MGKTARWFRGLLTKKDSTPSSSSSSKKKWTFVGSYRDRDKHPPPPLTTAEAPGKFTSSGRRSAAAAAARGNEVAAAVRIQKMFRGYLARRALKALRGVVRLQALVRGHITRKKKAEEMRCMQALLRLQSKARASRIQISETQHPNNQQSGPATPEKHERTIRSKSTRQDRSSPLKRNSSVPNNREAFDWDKTQLRRDCLDRRIDEHAWNYYCRETKMKYGLVDDNKTGKILETDRSRPHLNTKHQNQLSAIFDRLVFLDSPSKDSTSMSSGEVQSRNPRRPKTMSADSETFCTSENSPHFYSATSIPGSSKMGPFTPTTSDCSRSFHSVCTDHPNYMANTESSRAKARSQSAPKQRLEFEKSSSARRYNAAHGIHGSDDMRRKTLRASALQSSFASKEYPGSGRLDRLGMPTQHEYGGTYDNRY